MQLWSKYSNNKSRLPSSKRNLLSLLFSVLRISACQLLSKQMERHKKRWMLRIKWSKIVTHTRDLALPVHRIWLKTKEEMSQTRPMILKFVTSMASKVSKTKLDTHPSPSKLRTTMMEKALLQMIHITKNLRESKQPSRQRNSSRLHQEFHLWMPQTRDSYLNLLLRVWASLLWQKRARLKLKRSLTLKVKFSNQEELHCHSHNWRKIIQYLTNKPHKDCQSRSPINLWIKTTLRLISLVRWDKAWKFLTKTKLTHQNAQNSETKGKDWLDKAEAIWEETSRLKKFGQSQ